jgi:hypothetical protein
MERCLVRCEEESEECRSTKKGCNALNNSTEKTEEILHMVLFYVSNFMYVGMWVCAVNVFMFFENCAIPRFLLCCCQKSL